MMNQTEETKLLEQIEKWNDADEFSRCIEAIEAIPEQERGYLLTVKLSRAYSNLAALGDHGEHGTDGEVDGDLIRHAIELLESVRTQGENDPYWNARMGYSCLMAYGSATTAYEYAKCWLSLDPDDPDAQELVRDCEKYLEEENSLELDWKEREEIIRWETIPPADDDILGHVKVHIDQYFGVYTQLLTDDSDPDHPLEIAVILPRPEHDYYTLVTVGLSRHRMDFSEERREEKLERAELLINLPRDWKLTKADCREERWSWPIRMMLATAHFAMEDPEVGLESRTTLMEGEDGIPFAENTDLRGEILLYPGVFGEESFFCRLPDGDEVNFYQVIPLYRDELEYKMEQDADALLNKMRGISFVVNPTRQDAITRGALAKESFDGDMDNAAWHLETIREKHLPVDEINAYNHMAIYLRWCIEHDLMSVEFIERYNEQYQAFLADIRRADLRSFIRDSLKGQLFGALFNEVGSAFAGYYYGVSDSPYFPSDIDDYALRFFGPERYHSDEFQDEAYLFIPFDEDYYQAMAKVIEERFANWQGQDFDEDTLEPSELAEALMEYLDCECTYFPSMADDDPIMSAYSYARRLGVREDFIPVLIKADDETLLECLVMNADPEHDADCYEFDLKTVEAYRKKMLSAPIKDGKAVLEGLTGQRREEAEDDDMDWEGEVLGEMEGGYDNDRLSCYWGSDSHMTYPLILAKIPVKNPWEIFAYLPFGNWNECPDTPDLMAVAKYWFEQYGAVPAAMSHDELEFLLPDPVSKEKAMEVATEQYGFCSDIVDQEQDDPTVGNLADVLWQSTVWYFWWD